MNYWDILYWSES